MKDTPLSPNQKATTKFPLVGEREPSAAIRDWQLEVKGLVEQPLRLTLKEFFALPMTETHADTICVTGWTHPHHRWSGVPLEALLNLATPLPAACFVRFVAYSVRDHDTSLPLDYALKHVLLAHAVDGIPLTREHGAPVRTVCTGKYFYKSIKWLQCVELLAHDQPGYWERNSAYHNNADPWREERFMPQPMPPDEFAQRCQARDFSGAHVIKDEQFQQLRGRDLSGANFEGAQIKACDLGGAILRQANCRGANFTLCKFRDTDLQGAVLRDCDLEGADLRGANLSQADLRNASLTATRFAHQNNPALIIEARFLHQGIEIEGVDDIEIRFLMDSQQRAFIQ